MPLWLSGDSTTFVKSYINTGGSSPSKGSTFNCKFMGKSYKQGKNREKYSNVIKKKTKNKNYSIQPFLDVVDKDK